MNKFRISLLDFTPHLNTIPIGATDKNGIELHAGDIVKDDKGEKHFIAYRYGNWALKQPHTMHTIMPKDFSQYERINEIWAVLPGEWLIIGYDNEPLYEKVKDIDSINLLPQ